MSGTRVLFALCLYRRQLSVLGNNSVLMTPEEAGEAMKGVAPMFEEGKLKAMNEDLVEKVTLDKAVEAYEEMGKGSKKKFVIVN